MSESLVIKVGTSITSRSGIRYRVLQFLGGGGNSVVYLVLALNGEFHGVPFALNVFTRLSSIDRSERFEQAIEFLRQSDHPSIMRIYDTGTYICRNKTGNINYPFVTVEYLPESLHRLIRGSTMTMPERVSYTLQLLSALAYLDQNSPPVIHRDIKPKNIFVKGRSCVLGDFGLMKFQNQDDERDREFFMESTSAGMPYYYRTPDLVSYAKDKTSLTTKTDVFQLGLVIAEIFTGWNPEKLSKNILEPVKLDRIKFIPGALGVRMRELIENMLDFDPQSRPAAADVIDSWEGIFREIVDRCHQLDGRVF